MKLLRHGLKGQERPALLDGNGQLRDLSVLLPDITPSTLSQQALNALRFLDAATLPLVANLGPIAVPWSGMGKFLCVGLNYADHAAEANMPIPKEPIIFMKPPNVAVGAEHALVMPRGSKKTD